MGRRHARQEQLRRPHRSPTPATSGATASKSVSAYQQEHENLIASIRAGEPINEAQTIAESTMTAILGREAAYSGQEVTWDQAMQSTTHLGPDKYDLGPHEVPPVARPGIYHFS